MSLAQRAAYGIWSHPPSRPVAIAAQLRAPTPVCVSLRLPSTAAALDLQGPLDTAAAGNDDHQTLRMFGAVDSCDRPPRSSEIYHVRRMLPKTAAYRRFWFRCGGVNLTCAVVNGRAFLGRNAWTR
jgi:hypothetical protein